MYKALASAVVFGVTLASTGCGQSATQKLSDTSYDVAMAERFGRLDIVTDQVAPAHRDAFIEAHADWGGEIRIVDLEYGGMRLSDERHADVLLTVSWQRYDEFSLRTTKLKQEWVHEKDRWYIANESEVSGDRGLLDEADPIVDGKETAASRGPKAHKKKKRGPHDNEMSAPPEGRTGDPGGGFDDPPPISVD